MSIIGIRRRETAYGGEVVDYVDKQDWLRQVLARIDDQFEPTTLG